MSQAEDGAKAIQTIVNTILDQKWTDGMPKNKEEVQEMLKDLPEVVLLVAAMQKGMGL